MPVTGAPYTAAPPPKAPLFPFCFVLILLCSSRFSPSESPAWALQLAIRLLRQAFDYLY
jgi:hypothetical protein